MSTENQGPVAATYHELKAALVGADAPFIASQLDGNSTLADAIKNWMAEQNSRVATAKEAAANAAKNPPKPGVPAFEERGKASGAATAADPIADWEAAVNAEKAKGVSPSVAVARANAKNPGLREQMLAAVNAGRK